MLFRCARCRHVSESDSLSPSCGRCRGAVFLEGAGRASVSRGELEDSAPGVWRYRDLFQFAPPEVLVTLGEGGTPLLRAERLGRELALRNLLVKDESRNPTGSFMDRGTTTLVSVAKERGVRECSCDTTGNLGASLAAYCAKASIRARIHVSPNTDQGKLYQMLAYGAELQSSAVRHPAGLALEVSAANPFLLEGEKTTGFEIVQDLGWEEPDVVVVPVGTGGHLSMIWRSIGALREAGLSRNGSCRIVGVELGEAVSKPQKAVPASDFPLAELADSQPFYRKAARAAVEESGGLFLETTPGETIAATSLLAKSEGIFAEPSSASVVAALAQAVRDGLVETSETVVCVVTGAGLKDPRSVSRVAREARRVGPRPFAPPSIKVGETKLAILGMLRSGQGYAYDLWRSLRARRSISTASVYQHLLELEEFGMIRKKGTVVSGGRERILYEVTKRGAEYLKITEKLAESQDRS